mgnify:CR=1 FL=1
MKRMNPSDKLECFLSYLEEVKKEYEENFAIVGEEDRWLQDYLHALEFAPNKQERNKVATQFQQSRRLRRKAKDKVMELEKVYDFQKDQANRPVLKRLKATITQQKGNEQFLAGPREYKKRVSDSN